MSYSCPLNFIQVDANASRLSSLIVASLVILYLITSIEYILYFLILDFSIKLFFDKKYSAIFQTSMFLRRFLRFEEKFTDGGAKRLAGMFGLVFVFSLLVTHLFAFSVLTLVVAGIFLICSLLDVFLNYCLGCKIYYIIKKMHPNFMS